MTDSAADVARADEAFEANWMKNLDNSVILWGFWQFALKKGQRSKFTVKFGRRTKIFSFHFVDALYAVTFTHVNRHRTRHTQFQTL